MTLEKEDGQPQADIPVVAVVGLGFIGLTVAVEFARSYSVIGYDIDTERVVELQQGVDRNHLIGEERVLQKKISYSDNANILSKANFYIVCVSTPLGNDDKPDLNNFLNAIKTLAGYIKKNDVVVLESSVYPGFTEQECIPLMEKVSGLKAGKDFYVGFSPERVNIGDQQHNFQQAKKLISGQTKEALQKIKSVYHPVLNDNLVEVSTIQVAESAKLVENIQRDVLIAYANEVAVMLDQMGIDSHEVLQAAGTKWNFCPAQPGLVGGDCIGINTRYLMHQCEKKTGYRSKLLDAVRERNEKMSDFVVRQSVQQLVRTHGPQQDAVVSILGFTFKEDVSAINNSKVIDLVDGFQAYGFDVQVHDPLADPQQVESQYQLQLTEWDKLKPADIMVLAVAHQPYLNASSSALLKKLNGSACVVDLKGALESKFSRNNGVNYMAI